MTYAEYSEWLRANANAAPSPEWQITMLFYAVVHATNAVLYGQGRAPETHRRHEANLEQHPTLVTFTFEYEILRGLSNIARYKPHLHPMTGAQAGEAERAANVLFRACGL